MAFEADPGQAAPNYAGGAAAGYVAAGGLNAEAVTRVSAETQKLVSAAKSGGFKITAKGVEPLRRALLDMSNELDRLAHSNVALTQPPQLGSHPYGQAVAAHDQKGASQAAGSVIVVLEQFRQVLKDADEALARAAGLYQEVEQGAADTVNSIKV